MFFQGRIIRLRRNSYEFKKGDENVERKDA